MNVLRGILAVVLLACASVAPAQGFDHAHRAWDALLKKHVVLVSGGKASQLRYAAFGRDREALKAYLAGLSAVTAQQFAGWTKPQRMAFLINAYNAFTVELMLAHYPVASIKDIGGLFDNRWKRKFFKLLGEDAWLDKIEHEMLRKPGAYDEPRVHYAVNCASIGCPMLREEAYVAARLGAQLEQQAVRFLSDASRNRWNPESGQLEVSEIFKWFREDWESGYRGFDGRTPAITSREAYFARYAAQLAATPEGRAAVAARQAPITHLDYDWSINDVKR